MSLDIAFTDGIVDCIGNAWLHPNADFSICRVAPAPHVVPTFWYPMLLVHITYPLHFIINP
jgi:hypothetical protein